MPKIHDIRVRMSKTERETITENARAKGHSHISSYIRDLALKKDRILEEKILETNQMVKKILEAMQNG